MELIITKKDKCKIYLYEKCLTGYKDYINQDIQQDIGDTLLKIEIDDIQSPKCLSELNENERVLVFKALNTANKNLYETMLDKYYTYQKEQTFIKVVDKNIGKYANYCGLCNNTGVVKNEFGVEIVCTCQKKKFSSKNKPKKEHKTDSQSLTNIIEKVKLITNSEKIDTKYDTDKVLEEINSTANKNQFKLSGFVEYDKKLHEIIDSIRNGKYRELNSYLLGAPTGFGQEDFIDECLIALIGKGAKVVPYITLTRLMEIRVEKNRNTLLKVQENDLESYKQEFSWGDYANADVAFVRIDDLDNKFMETKALYMLMQERNIKKLPTIVLTNFNLRMYTSDSNLKLHFWDDMINFKSTEDKYKLNYLYTYKKYY